MPIRPENRHRYGADWPEFSNEIRFGRAGGRCECEGECGLGHRGRCDAKHGAWGYREDGVWKRVGKRALREAGFKPPGDVGCHSGSEQDGTWREYSIRVVEVVLTVAHLDHTPETRDPEKVKAMCQGCHLHYDRQHHAQTAYMTRRQGKAAGDLFEVES